MSGFIDAIGTSAKFFQLSIYGPLYKIFTLTNNIKGYAFRNATDTADAPISTSTLYNSGPSLVLNSGATNSYALTAPPTNTPRNLTFPATPSVAGYALVAADANDTLSYVALPSNNAQGKTISVAFSSTSPVPLITLPIGAIIRLITLFVDTPWSGFSAGNTPTVSIGTAANPTLFATIDKFDLTDAISAKSYSTIPTVAPNAAVTQLVATFTNNSGVTGGSTAGSGRIVIDYSLSN